jgi:hypothetical protein
MTVLIVYVLLVSALEIGVFFVGIAIDKVVPDGVDMIIAMAMFFGVIWGTWPVAVYITERWLDTPDRARRARHSAPAE